MIVSDLLSKVGQLLLNTPLSLEEEERGTGYTDLLFTWETSEVYDSYNYISHSGVKWVVAREGIDQGDLRELLSKCYTLVERNHKGFVEEGTSDIDEGVYRIRIHEATH